MKTLAVDLGGTVIKAGVLDNGKVSERAEIKGHSEQGVDQALSRLADMLRSFGAKDAAGVAIALPTLVDVRTGKVLVDMKGKYEGLREADLVAWCRKELDLPLRIENDAHAALLGEWRRGAGVNCDNLVMITIGTGLGTSVLIEGKCLRGKHAQAGNLGGHFVVDPNGFDCVCGGKGCVEAQQRRPALTSLAKADARYAKSPLSNEDEVDYGALFQFADSDSLSRELLDRSIQLWGMMIISLVHQFDCERVIVGGGIMKSANVILPRLQAAADRACTPWGRVEVKPALLGNDAALIGLASLFENPPEYL